MSEKGKQEDKMSRNERLKLIYEQITNINKGMKVLIELMQETPIEVENDDEILKDLHTNIDMMAKSLYKNKPRTNEQANKTTSSNVTEKNARNKKDSGKQLSQREFHDRNTRSLYKLKMMNRNVSQITDLNTLKGNNTDQSNEANSSGANPNVDASARKRKRRRRRSSAPTTPTPYKSSNEESGSATESDESDRELNLSKLARSIRDNLNKGKLLPQPKNNQDLEEEVQEIIEYHADTTSSGGKPPPFIINDPIWDWVAMRDLLKANEIKDYHGKITPQGILIQSDTIDVYRLIQKLVKENEIKAHTYLLKEEKPLKAVIKSIPANVPTQEIYEALIDKHFPVNAIRQMVAKREGKDVPLPIFVLTLSNSPEAKKIFQLRDLLHLRIKVEPYKRRKTAIQCFKCEKFGHAQSGCFYDPRCVKCSGSHLSRDCDNTRPIKCANCGLGHTANATVCQYHPRNPLNMKNNTDRGRKESPSEMRRQTIVSNAATTAPPPNMQDETTELINLISWVKNSGLVELLKSLKNAPINHPNVNE